MAIDISLERVVSLTEATQYLPRRRAGKKPNVATLYRWAQQGVRGIRLETICVGATRCTSVEALQRFFDALTLQAEPKTVVPQPRQPAHRQKAIAAAEKRLAQAGI